MADWIANRFIFYPMKYPGGDWDLQRSARAEDRWIRSAGGIRLNAWWFPSPKARLVTLFLHGNAGNVTHRIDHADAIRQARSQVLVVDYRGYGKSNGTPSERGLYQDGDATYDELVRAGFDPSQIVLHGESLGTAVAVDVAARRRCAGLILEAPLSSAQDVAAGVVPILGPALVRGFESQRKISRVHAPVFVIHGDRDEVIPFSQGRAVFDAANKPKWFWQVRGAMHNDLQFVAGREYVPRLREFYAHLGV